jgi:hypothetical protein
MQRRTRTAAWGAAAVLAAAAWLGAAGGAAAQGSVATDRAALVALYHATDGPNWDVNANWLSDEPIGHSSECASFDATNRPATVSTTSRPPKC